MLKHPIEPQADIVDTIVQGFAIELPQINSLTLETICRLIVAGKRLERVATDTLKQYGFSYADFDVLGMLRSAGPPFELSPADLMRFTMITSGAMTACLNRLERSEMITRRENPTDRRVRIIALTTKGKNTIEQAFTQRFDDAELILSDLTQAEKKRLNSLLRTVCVSEA